MALVALLSSRTAGASIEMDQVAIVPAGDSLLSKHPGIDLDNDGAREFMMTRSSNPGILNLYESTADDAFSLAYILDLSAGGTTSAFGAADTGDADGDGLVDLLVPGSTQNGNTRYVRIYESTSANAYPSALVWQLTNWAAGGRIRDTDNDGSAEIVIAGTRYNDFGSVIEKAVAVYENAGDNSYAQTFYEVLPFGAQSFEVADDLDGDGRDEILTAYGTITVRESVGDDAYQQIWTHDLLYDDGQGVNTEFLVDAGDLDGDGRKEFLTGGLKTIGQGGGPMISVVYLFETTADNEFAEVQRFTFPVNAGSLFSRGNVADVDGDGNREIVLTVGTEVHVLQRTGDTWSEVWLGSISPSLGFSRFIGAGDHDQDGKEELIFRTTVQSMGVFEIDPTYAADLDGDGRVDAIDNCPAAANPDQEDADGDTVGDACDNCVYGPNPTQGPAVFGQAIKAGDREKFVWTSPADILYVRGSLAGVGSYEMDFVNSLSQTIRFTDAQMPPAGGGFFYLVRPDCPVGSWQSSPGAEPGRDATLP